MKKLLAIVDDWEKLEVYEDRLKALFEVHCAPFGSTGMEMAQEMNAAGEAPDVILIDLVFEDMDEFEAEGLLLRDPALAYIPRVLITESDRSGHPGSHLVRRPYSFEELLRILQAPGS